jgi:hypothetical protein
MHYFIRKCQKPFLVALLLRGAVTLYSVFLGLFWQGLPRDINYD